MQRSTRIKTAAIATSIAFAVSGCGIALAEEAATTTNGTETVEQTTEVADDTQTSTTQSTTVSEGAENTSATELTTTATSATEETKTSTDGESTEATTDGEADDAKTTEATTDSSADEYVGLMAQATTQEMTEEGWKEYWAQENFPEYKDIEGYRIYYRDGRPLMWAKLSDEGTPMAPGQAKPEAVELESFPGYRLVSNGAGLVQRVINYEDVDQSELIASESGGNTYWYRDAWYVLQDGRLYAILQGDPGAPAGVSNSTSATTSSDTRAATTRTYVSGTAALTPATGTSYTSPTAAASTTATATEAAIPTTSDPTSFVGAIASAFSAFGAFGAARALRRRG